MPYCPNCGTESQGSFCPKCGTAIGGGTAQQASSAPPPPATPAASGGLEANVASALCYLFGLLTGILFLVLEPHNKNKTVRFHAFQSIFLHLAAIVIYVIAIPLSFVLIWLPGGGYVSTLLYTVLGFGGFALWIYLMYKAYNNERLVLPIIGPLAEKQA